VTAGTAQGERFPPRLAPGWFAPDELGFEQRVAMTAALARHLRFVALDHPEGGDWRRLFESDVALVLARIAAIDLRALQHRFLRGADAGPVEHLAHQVVQLAQWIDLWFKSLDRQGDPVALAFRARIRQLVEQQLGEDLRWVYAQFGTSQWRERRIDHTEGRLADIWDQGRPLLGADLVGRSKRELLRERYFAFLSAIETLQDLARELLPSTLKAGTHAPAEALLIAFLKLWETVQQELNQFTARHVDFYYRDCLGLAVAGAQPDDVHLACARDARAGGLLRVPQGTVFEAGKGPDGQPMVFHSAAPLVVTDAAVAALCTLRLERDALISPERSFGYATRAKATRLAPLFEQPAPLFGGGRGFGAEDARLGLAIASPLLLLREGERSIRVDLPARAPLAAGADAAELDALVDAVAATQDTGKLQEALGRLFGHWLLIGQADLSATQLQRLRSAAARVLGARLPHATSGGDPLSLLAGTRPPVRALVFDRLFQGLFQLRLSAADGWLEVNDAQVGRLAEGGLSIELRLRPEAPPIVGCDPLLHGEGWDTRLPMLRIELATQGRLYGHSLLADLPLAEARVHVTARGVRDIVLHNNLGRLDPTKAFNPFGPLPTLSSYLVVGAQEISGKQLQKLSLQVEWGALPADPGGFDRYYRGYPDEQRSGDYTVALAILRDGAWQPCAGDSPRQPLFAPPDRGGCLLPRMEIVFDPDAVRKHSRASDAADWGAPWPRNGLYRLQLNSPRGAFGHAAYPMVLAETVGANARRRSLRRQEPLPNPPYTPLVETLALSYEAAGVIRLDAEHHPSRRDTVPGAQDHERLLHLHPFGIERLHSAAAGQPHGLMPRVEDDGNLYIGVSASEPGGTLTLLFQLSESAADARSSRAQRGRVRWATLADDHWHPLAPTRVLSDSTEGFLSSGIVTLDLPGEDMGHDNDVMPAGLYWLRASADEGFEGFAALLGVQAHALRARRVLAPGAAALAIVPHGSITKPSASVPGLAGVRQVGPSFGLRAPEDPQGLYTRAGERLRHKQRASTAWDAERLLLAAFPEVFKARCLSGDEIVAAGLPRPPAGQVLVVAVPQVPRNDWAHALEAPRFNANELQNMQQYLQARASPFAQVVVRNPVYDRIQLRCSVGLAPGAHEGEVLQRLNATTVRLLSPWFDEGYAPDFDWVVRSEDLEARLRELDGVAYVTRLSLLHVGCTDDGIYTLGDTAREGAGAEGRPGGAARRGNAMARAPWSLALPLATHIVEAERAPDAPQTAPQPTGIARLAIGSTFVIAGADGVDA
jgi:hypothetical protein